VGILPASVMVRRGDVFLTELTEFIELFLGCVLWVVCFGLCAGVDAGGTPMMCKDFLDHFWFSFCSSYFRI
jgi:hypothetical protein